jgi:hypothetical protein
LRAPPAKLHQDPPVSHHPLSAHCAPYRPPPPHSRQCPPLARRISLHRCQPPPAPFPIAGFAPRVQVTANLNPLRRSSFHFRCKSEKPYLASPDEQFAWSMELAAAGRWPQPTPTAPCIGYWTESRETGDRPLAPWTSDQKSERKARPRSKLQSTKDKGGKADVRGRGRGDNTAAKRDQPPPGPGPFPRKGPEGGGRAPW